MKNDKPVVVVLVSPTIEEGEIEQVLYGLEEEAVPFAIHKGDNETAINLGYRAASLSRLGVGVGLGKDQLAVLHYEKLKKEAPIFQMSIQDRSRSLRALGVNAARLVKGMPFKELKSIELEVQYNNQITKEKITEIVKKVLSELAKEG